MPTKLAIFVDISGKIYQIHNMLGGSELIVRVYSTSLLGAAMKRFGFICLLLFVFSLLLASMVFAWQEPSPGNWVSDAPPVVNPQLNATGGSAVDVLSGHSVNGALVGIGLLTAGYTVTNSGSIFGPAAGVLFQQGGALKNYGTIAGSNNGVFSVNGSLGLDNQGEIAGGLLGVISFAPNGNIDIFNTGRITGTNAFGIWAQSLNGNVSVNNQGEITGGNIWSFSVPQNGNVDIVNTGRITGTNVFGVETFSLNGNVSVNNQGDITGGAFGVYSIAYGNIDVTNSGRITGTSEIGVLAQSSNGNIVLNNQGHISGDMFGVHLITSPNGSVNITNSGTIAATDSTTGVGVYVPVSGNLAITNSGTISGLTGIWGSAANSATYFNYGTIIGSGVNPILSPSYAGPAAIYHLGAATLENWGSIQGDVVFPGAYPHSVVLHTGTAITGSVVGGPLTDNLTLDGSGTFNFQVTDFDSLTKTGAGIWNLAHDLSLGTAPGTASINGGTLAVNANLTASQVSVLSGAALQGTGTVISNVNNAGTVGPGNSIGTLNIRGNFVQGATGTLAIEIDPTGAHDVLAVTGTASLAGRLDVYPLGFVPNRSYYGSILTAGGGVSGQFGQVLIPGSSVLSIMPMYHSNSVDFLFSRYYSGVAWGQQRLAVAQAIDSITSLGAVSADLQSILSSLDMSSVSDINLSLGQMHPAIYDGLKEASFIQGRFFADASLARLDTLRGTPSTGGAQSKTSTSGESEVTGWNPEPLKRVSFFMQGGGEFYDRSSAFERVGYSFSGGSFLGGADYALSPWLTAGLAAGYAGSSLDFDDLGGSKAELDSVYMGGYAGLNFGDYFADLSLGYVFNSYDMHRRMLSTVFDTTAHSSFDGGEFLTKFQFGRRFEVSGFGLTPVVKLEYANLDRDSFVENGAGGLNLAVNSHGDESMQSTLGGSVDYKFDFGDWYLRPIVKAYWIHEMLDDNLDYLSTLSGIPNSPFVTTAMAAETDAAKLGATVEIGIGKYLIGYVSYDAVLVSGYDWHNISGGLKVTF